MSKQLETSHNLKTKISPSPSNVPLVSQDISIKTDPANSDYTV